MIRECVVIPCFEHADSVGEAARAARAHGPVIVVDDGSRCELPIPEGCEVIRLERNSGKGAALRVGFARAIELGFTHAISMDADGQHSASDIPRLLAVAAQNENALIMGVRDFLGDGAPPGRRRANAFSTFWFRMETGIRLGDTQCGFRCYPLDLVKELKVGSGGYAFESEFLVRAAWVGAPILPVPVACLYLPEQLRQSHFRPITDCAHIALVNAALVLQSCLFPRSLRMAWSRSRFAEDFSSASPGSTAPVERALL